MKDRFLRTTAAVLIVLPLLTGCSEKSTIDISREAFDKIAEDAVSLYITMHPLRSSRLGLEGADSLLFTFSPDEIEHALTAIDTLMDAISALSLIHI